MRTAPLGLLVVTVAALLAHPACAQRRGPSAQYGWLSSYQQGREQARQTGKPLMIVLRCVP